MHVYNHTPICRLNWKTPIEIFLRNKPDVSYFRTFGCGAYMFIPRAQRKNKLSPDSKAMIFIGYNTGSKGYIFMHSNNALYYGAQACFIEDWFPRCRESDKSHKSSNKPSPIIPSDKPPTQPTDDPADNGSSDDNDPFNPSHISFTSPDKSDHSPDQPGNFDNDPDDADDIYTDAPTSWHTSREASPECPPSTHDNEIPHEQPPPVPPKSIWYDPEAIAEWKSNNPVRTQTAPISQIPYSPAMGLEVGNKG